MLDTPIGRPADKDPCWKHRNKGYRKGCKYCFDLNRRRTKEEIQRDLDEEDGSYMGSYDGWND